MEVEKMTLPVVERAFDADPGELVEIEGPGVPATDRVAAALAKAQLAFRAIIKDKQAVIEKKAGGKYTYRYADLASIFEVVRQPLADNELALSQPIRFREGGLWLDTILMHSSGQSITGEYPLPPANAGSPQAMGSAITYARRYCLGGILGIATEEDDDGKKASSGPKRITKQQYGALVSAAKVKGLDKDGFVALIEKVCDHQNPTRLTVPEFEKALAILKLEDVADQAIAASKEAKTSKKEDAEQKELPKE